MSRRLWTFVCQHKQLLHRRKSVTHFQKELEENKANGLMWSLSTTQEIKRDVYVCMQLYLKKIRIIDIIGQ